jgi:hypothetical protein
MALAFSVGIYQTAPVAEMIRLTRLAEDLGFETAWLGDSQCLWREAYVTLGALAVSTRSIKLGTSVTNPMTRHLTVTASALCSLAELTGGRVLLGIGRGETAVKLAGARRATLGELRDAVPTSGRSAGAHRCASTAPRPDWNTPRARRRRFPCICRAWPPGCSSSPARSRTACS